MFLGTTLWPTGWNSASYWVLYEDDLLVLEGDADGLKRVIDTAKLQLTAEKHSEADLVSPNVISAVEAVVMEGSVLIGSSAADMRLRGRYGVILLAISRRGRPVRQRLHQVHFQPGDLVVLQGRSEDMPENLAALGCLPLAERNLELGRRRTVVVPVVSLALAMGLVALDGTSFCVEA